MRQESLLISGCIAALATPSMSVADVLPENLVSLNLGEVRSSSFINEPFKGVIPFLFTSYESTKGVKVRLAPQSIFDKVGAEKHPILNSLNFQVTQQDDKPVILISSSQAIQNPFLNFVLEVEDSMGVVYQNYTVLLDSSSSPINDNVGVEYVNVDPRAEAPEFNEYIEPEEFVDPSIKYKEYVEPDYDLFSVGLLSNRITNDKSVSARKVKRNTASKSPTRVTTATSRMLKYRVKTGDSLSKIAQNHNVTDASLLTMSDLIFQKNPRAFIRGDKNKIKKGVLIALPTASEVSGFELARKKAKATSRKLVNNKKADQKLSLASAEIKTTTTPKVSKTSQINTQAYKVVKGDTLYQITKKFATKDVSFTKLMNDIHVNNPSAFVDNKKSKVRLGALLEIPSVISVTAETTKNEVTASLINKESKQAETAMLKPLTKESIVNTPNETIKAEITEAQNSDVKAIEKEIASNQYVIKEGDKLSQIIKDIGYTDVSYTRLLTVLYEQNPTAFVDGKIQNLITGAILTIPPLGYFDSTSTVSDVPKLDNQVDTANTGVAQTNKVASSDLVKRIRELRKELDEAKDKLSSMKRKLSNKELLLNQKDMQLDAFNDTLFKLKASDDLGILAATAVKTSMSAIKPKEQLNKASYQAKPKVEIKGIAELKRELIRQQTATGAHPKTSNTAISTDIGNAITSKDEAQFKEYFASSILNSRTNLAYSSAILLFGFLLLKYRRKFALSANSEHSQASLAKEDYQSKEMNTHYSDPKDKVVSQPRVSDQLQKIKKIDKATLDKLYEYVDGPDEFNAIVSDLFDHLDEHSKNNLLHTPLTDKSQFSRSISPNH